MATRGERRHYVLLHNPSGPVPDGDGGYTEGWAALSPPDMYAVIQPATVRDLERLVANTVQATASHIVTLDYHPQVTTDTRVTFGTRLFQVTGVQNVDERSVELRLACEEVVVT